MQKTDSTTPDHFMRGRLGKILFMACALVAAANAMHCVAQDDPTVGSRNQSDRLEWFRDQGFGLFIHWSMDGQLGVVISHSLVGASRRTTPTASSTICPRPSIPPASIPNEWARLATLAGVRYCDVHHQASFGLHDVSTPRRLHLGSPIRPSSGTLRQRSFMHFEGRELPPGFIFLRMISGGCISMASQSSGRFQRCSPATILGCWSTTRLK
jgi:hypothetical protein